jgi:hypothetical protein
MLCSIEALMKSGRELLLEHLHGLMKSKGWRWPDGEWNVPALHAKAGGSKRWLYRLVRGETDFGIDSYERVLQKGFGMPFATVIAGFRRSDVPRDVEDLYESLRVAIENAKETHTLEALRFALDAVFDKAAAVRALHDKTRIEQARDSPNPSPGRGGGNGQGRAKRNLKT